MSWLGWGPSVPPQFEELVEKACSPLNLPWPQSEDMATALEITDMIRAKTVPPKLAMQTLKRRVGSKNGRVQMYALGRLVDTCIKNGGDHFLVEIASKEFIDEMSGLIQTPGSASAEVKQMALKMFQSWALAFKDKKDLSFFVERYNEMKAAGVQFPPPPAQQAPGLLDTTTAPAWVDSDVCMRCRTAFTFTNRKHHCRNCGLVFDQACSSRTMPLPRFGITEPVRVCEGCWVKSGSGKSANAPPPVVPGRTPRTREDLDADLQRAIELSLAESQGRTGVMGSEPPIARRAGAGAEGDDDEQLRLAIEASLRDMESRPSAPIGTEEPEYKPLPTFDLAPRETETILTFSNTLDQMAAYGERDLRRFPHAHVLYEQAYALGGKLQRNAEEKTTKQQMLMEMQDKLSQAIGLYGQILDGQQAFTARKMQEEQQRRYQQYYNPQYAPQPPYGYSSSAPVPQMNGHASPYYSAQPPQAAYLPPQQQANTLYPNMPNMSASYIPYQVPPHQYQYRPDSAASTSTAVPQAYQPQQGVERSTSLRVSSGPQPAAVQRQASMTYGAPIERAPAPVDQSSPVDVSQPSAPPPAVDMASHPSSSPRSLKSTLPSAPLRSASYTSPPTMHQQLTSPPPQPSAPLQPVHEQQPQTNGWHQHPSQPYEVYSQEPPVQAHPHVYSAASFPVAPPAFPDAPSEIPLPQSQKAEPPQEALLIEL